MDTSEWYTTNGAPVAPPHTAAPSSSRPSDAPIHVGNSSASVCRDWVSSTCGAVSTVSTVNCPYVSSIPDSVPDKRPRR